MKKKRLGCLTANGLVAAFLTLLFIGGFSIARGGILFSPGDLNAQKGDTLGGVSSHDEIEECAACHTAVWDSIRMTDRCLDCHQDIAVQIESQDSLHGKMLSDAFSACQDCHTEHHGPEASLTEVDPETFPHELTGFSLNAHLQIEDPLECSDCHETLDEFLSGACTDCHTELDEEFLTRHIQDFGDACLNCHDGLETYGEGFVHNLLSFPLEGQHAALECSACHRNQSSIEELRLTPQECYACHEEDDSHQGSFGTICEKCHTAEGWDLVEFDHSRVEFPLSGKHVDVDCQECHGGLVFGEVPHTCFDCHSEDDEHDGNYGQNCEQCHTPEGWDQVFFDHDQSAFPLTGKHLLVDCVKCHEDFTYQPLPHTCFDCHAEDDAHNGELGTNCERCHVPDGWDVITFNHTLTSFPLTGAHISVTCVSCHQGGIFSGTPASCSACHADPAYHSGLFSSSCESCHNTSAWSPASFNLAHTFPLNHEGAGGRCGECHPSSLHSYTCFICHAQAEVDEEHRDEGISDYSDCMRCHPTGEEGDDNGGGDGGEDDDDD